MYIIIIIFICSLFFILHTYIFYPISIKILAFFIRKNYKTDDNSLPKVSILISAYNEGKVILKTLNNFYEQNYPKEKSEIIIGSDGSTDKTEEIVSQFIDQHSNFVFIPFEKRRGKKFVINDLVKEATGDILVFCDSNTIYNKDALSQLMRFYADERVGGVSGRLELIEETGFTEAGNKEAVYWEYESWIKECEGKLGALIGANGGIYSIRKEFFMPMPEYISVVDDLYLSLKVIEMGKDFLYCKKALAKEILAPSVKWEFERKVRIIPRSFETIKQVKSLLFNKRVIVSYGLWSHKLIRWLTPLLFILLLLSNIIISFNSLNIFYDIFLALQAFVITCGVVGYLFSLKNINIKIFQLTYYFFVTNYALLKGFYKYITKKYKPTWEPTPR